VGIKLQTTFVTSEVSMNVKSQTAQTVTVKITDISNRVVSKSVSDVKAGDNILKLYTSALPSSAYRIAIYDAAGNMLAITDFNKI
jgi:adenosine/AMP kinase